MAVSLYHRQIRRSSLCADLPAVSDHSWAAGHGHGVFRGPGQRKEHCPFLPCIGTEGYQVACLQLVRHRGQLPSDDVLYHHCRLAAAVLLQNSQGRLFRSGRRRRGRRIRHPDGPARPDDAVYGPGGGRGHRDLLPGPSKRSGKNHQGNDALSAGCHGPAGRPLRDPAGRRGRTSVLPDAQFPESCL